MIYVILAVFGLIFGSFANALVWRLHEQAELTESPKGKRQKAGEGEGPSERELSMLHGRSMCSNCHHELAPKDLVPLFSWLWLRGRCRYCHQPIQDSPWLEVVLPLSFIVSYLAWPLPVRGIDLLQFIVWLGFLVAFIALAAYDLRWFILPNRIVYPLIVLAVLDVVLIAVLSHNLHGLLNAVLAAVVIAGGFYALFQLSGGSWIGGGDVKLAVVLGLWAGTPLKALLLIFLSSLIGLLVSVPILAHDRQGMKARIPFGPFLLAATFVVVLVGDRLVHWYLHSLHLQ